jgi:hypothetical protein
MQNTATIDEPRTVVDDTPQVDWSMPRDKITEQLKRDGRLTIIENGCPIAVMLKVDDSTFEDTMLDLSRVQALRALKEMQASAAKSGLCNMTLEEINAEINAARAERKAREKSR